MMNYYDKDNIHSLVLPVSPLSTLVRDYWVPLIENGVGLALKQVQATCALAIINEKIIPILINEDSEHCSIVSSSCYFFLSGSVAYSKDTNPFIRLFFHGINLLHDLSRSLNFDRTVQVNQWLLPTNPLLDLTQDELQELIIFLKTKYPDHAILLKGITEEYAESSFKSALSLGARLIKMRWLYFWDTNKVNKKQLRNLRTKPATFEKIQDGSEVNRILILYDQLYREKHSIYSPDYTSYFFERLIESDYFHLFVMRMNHQIESFYFYSDNGIFLQLGIIGYNINLPQDNKLYPCLITTVTELSKESQKPISLGAGSGQFKRYRGAFPINEYDACFIEHLPWKQQFLWILFSKSTQSKFMRYFFKNV